jgi:AcrR family transcriptional regulator
MTAIVREMPAAKRALMTEGLKLFASRGIEAVSVRDIARATGFSNPVLFRHFAGKEALAATLFEGCYRSLIEALEAADQALGLESWLEAALTEIAASPEAVVFVLENLKRYFATLPEELQRRNLPLQVAAMVQREQAAGRIRSELDIRLAVVVITGALGQLARAAHFRDSSLDAAATAAGLARLLGAGFSPREVVR